MLTPRFTFNQDEKFLTINIYAPFTHIDQTEIFMDGEDFRFSSAPYYLRLHLPGEVKETEEASGLWDADSTSFVVKCPKVNVGKYFEGLENITKLLTPKGDTEIKTSITSLIDDDELDEEYDDSDPQWYMEQNYPPDQEISVIRDIKRYGYGFACKHMDVFSKLSEELGCILDIPGSEANTHKEREEVRSKQEERDFDESHYLCDLFEDEGVKGCLEYKPPWNDIPANEKSHPYLAFDSDEQELLLGLPKKKIIVDSAEVTTVHLVLAEILFAVSYTLRINQGWDNVETRWNVVKLAPSLCCLSKPFSPSQVVKSSIRRALCYPLYRHWELAQESWSDVVKLLKIGKAAILKQFLSLIPHFNDSPGYYIFNQLFIQDYCLWLQYVPEKHLLSLATALQMTCSEITKSKLELDLEELETAAKLTIEEEEADGLCNKIKSVTISSTENDSDDSDNDSSESNSDETDSDDTTD